MKTKMANTTAASNSGAPFLHAATPAPKMPGAAGWGVSSRAVSGGGGGEAGGVSSSAVGWGGRVGAAAGEQEVHVCTIAIARSVLWLWN